MLGDYSISELDNLIRETSAKQISNADKIVLYSELLVGTTYVLECLADGPYAKYEQGPLFNLKQLNCMTYCEHVLALALSSHYEEMFNVLQHIRYRNGIIGMATRNHYTMADWGPNNQWCLEDVSQKVGQKHAKPVTRTISHKQFFADIKYTDSLEVVPDRSLTIYYVVINNITDCVDRLNSGDIVSIIQDRPGIFSAHMGLIIKKSDGKTYFRHASMSKKRVLDEPLAEYVVGLIKNDKRFGMAFLRVREQIEWVGPDKISHGKVMQ